jgi:hypothetical protein
MHGESGKLHEIPSLCKFSERNELAKNKKGDRLIAFLNFKDMILCFLHISQAHPAGNPFDQLISPHHQLLK